MKKKGKFYFFKYFILAVVLFSLIKITDFSKKIYFVNKYDYNQRIRINYSYCKDGSIPFLLFIKENYKDITPNVLSALKKLSNQTCLMKF